MPRAKTTILIVDDDRELQLGLGVRLRAQGYRVLASLDPVGAVSIAIKESPHVILLDLGLPGQDGIQCLQRLRWIPATARIPVVVLTGRDRSWEEKALALDAFAFLQKPADNEELLRVVAAAAASRQRSRRVRNSA